MKSLNIIFLKKQINNNNDNKIISLIIDKEFLFKIKGIGILRKSYKLS